ncbi:Chromosome segregation protein, partial [Aspergillus sclerotialis]
KEREDDVKTKLSDAETSRQRLYAKQGRNSRFKSKSERDKWLQAEIKDNRRSLSTVEGVMAQTNEDIKELESEISSLESETQSLRDQVEGRGDAVHSVDEQLQRAKDERDRLMDQR